MGMSSQSPSLFNDSLVWEFNFYNARENEEPDINNEILTSLVRTSYMKYLQKSLTNNYAQWLEKNEDNDDVTKLSEEDIVKCAMLLEHKALRACMVTSYYQRHMNEMMKEIKQSTEEGSLFSPLVEQICDNITNINKEFCDKDTQTDPIPVGCLVEDECIVSQCREKQPSTLDITLENSNLIIINPCNDLVREKENSDTIEDLFNILMNSPSLSDKDSKDKFHSPKKRKYPEDPVNFDRRPFHVEKKYSENLVHVNDEKVKISKIKTSSFGNDNGRPFELNIPAAPIPQMKSDLENFCKTETIVEDVPMNINSSLSVVEQSKSNLDKRLEELAALFGDESPVSDSDALQNNNPSLMNTLNDGIISSEETCLSFTDNCSTTKDQQTKWQTESSVALPLDWKLEFAAENCHLKVLLSRMSFERRQKIQKLFRELFGHDYSLNTNISLNEEALCRKRTANLVVGELTRHYIAGRIGSRELFKSLAKKITDDLLSLSYVTGQEEIQTAVNSYFENGRSVNSRRDF